MEKLNVMCSACIEGRLVVLNLLNDDYKMGCDTCDHTFTTHYTGFDALMDEHSYNEQVGKDVQMLSANGTWISKPQDRCRYDGKDIHLIENFTKNMKLIQSIDAYEVDNYYQDGSNFVLISHNPIHDTYQVYRYEANENGMQNLMNHFFGQKV